MNPTRPQPPGPRPEVDPSALTDRALTLAAVVPAALLFVPLLLPLFANRVFAADDLIVFHLPLRMLYSQALAQGESILWTPHLFNGFYLHGEGQIGALHPLHLMLYRLAPLVLAFNLELTLSYLAAFLGMWVFLARLGFAGAAGILGATAFAFSGFNLLHYAHMNAVAIAAHIPWLLAATDLLVSGPRRWQPLAFGATALLVGSQVLLGYPQYVWISALIVATYAALRAWRFKAWGGLVLTGMACILGLAVGAAQLLPTLDLFDESVRPAATRNFAFTFSLHPANLVQFWSPYFFEYRVFAREGEHFVHEFGAYNGALCTIAFGWVLFRWRQLQDRHAAGVGLTLCALGILLALGRYGFIYELLTALPVVASFRAAARNLLMVHLGLAILLAVAFEDLVRMRHDSGRRRVRLPWVGLPVALSAAAATWIWLAPNAMPDSMAAAADVRGALAGLVLFAIPALIIPDAVRGNRTALLALPLFGAVDLGLWGYSYVWARPSLPLSEVAAMADLPPAFREGMSVHLGDLDARRNLALLHGLTLFEPYVGLIPSRRLDPESEEAQRLGGVQWALRDGEWHAVPDPFPRARVLGDARRSETPSRDARAIDLSSTALTSVDMPSLDRAATGDVHVVVDRPGRMEMDVTAGGRLLLVTTESYHAGWTARAGDRPLTTLAVNGDFLGVLLEPGAYRLNLRFAPSSARTGVAVSLVAALAALSVGLVSLRRRSSSVMREG